MISLMLKLYELVKPQSVLVWIRVRSANIINDSGESWYEIFSKYNSSTYNNQYMVLDHKKIKKFNALANNTLWVIE